MIGQVIFRQGDYKETIIVMSAKHDVRLIECTTDSGEAIQINLYRIEHGTNFERHLVAYELGDAIECLTTLERGVN